MLTSAGGIQLEYDKAGNLTLKGQKAFEWDYLGRLIKIKLGNKTLSENFYDFSKSRIRKKGISGESYYITPEFEIRNGKTTIYLNISGKRNLKVESLDLTHKFYPDLAPAQEKNGKIQSLPDQKITSGDAYLFSNLKKSSPKNIKKEFEGIKTEDLLNASLETLLIGNQEKLTYLHNDYLGSFSVSSNASGKVLKRNYYYPFGLLRFSTNKDSENYTFNGKEFNPNTELSYYGARFYDPYLSRWASVDKKFLIIDEKVPDNYETNPYVFAKNNPITQIDTNGEEPVTVTIAVLMAAGRGAAQGAATEIAEQMVGQLVGHLEKTGSLKGFDFENAVDNLDGKKIAKEAAWGGITFGLNKVKTLGKYGKMTADLGKHIFDDLKEKGKDFKLSDSLKSYAKTKLTASLSKKYSKHFKKVANSGLKKIGEKAWAKKSRHGILKVVGSKLYKKGKRKLQKEFDDTASKLGKDVAEKGVDSWFNIFGLNNNDKKEDKK